MDIFDACIRFFGRDLYEFQTLRRTGGSLEILPKQPKEGDSDDLRAAGYCRRVLSDMDSCGVSRAVIHASLPQDLVAVGEAALESNGRLVPFAAVNPLSVSPLVELAALQPRYGFRGMVLFPFVHEYDLSDSETSVVLDFAAAHDMIVFVHCGAKHSNVRALIGLDADPANDDGRVRDMTPVAQSRPDQNFTVPLPDEASLEVFLELGAACGNVYANTAVSGTKPGDRQALVRRFEAMRRAFGVRRILYGSNSGGFSRDYRRDVLEAQIGAMTEAGYTEDELAAVLGGNLTRLLGQT